MNPDGSGVIQLTNDSKGSAGPAWSRDDRKIAFTRSRDGNSEIYVMNADGTGQTRLTNHPAGDSDPTWSP
jgi:Tol biopolymer transport system component